MTNRWRELREAVELVARQLDQLDRRTEKMETIIMVREPSSGAAAEAYEGLRKQVVTAVSERMTHLAQLAQLDAALAAGAGPDSVGKLVRGWMEQASVVRVSDPDDSDRDLLFELVEDLGGPFEVLEPAYADAVSGRVIRRGTARRAPVLGGRPGEPQVADPRGGDPRGPRHAADTAQGQGQASWGVTQ